MPYAVRKYYPHTPPLARLYVTTYEKGVHFYERPSVNSVIVGRLYGRSLFHGAPAANDRWVRRLPSEGGGFAVALSVQEVV